MTSAQIAKLNMYNAVISYCNASNVTIAAMPPLKLVFEQFQRTVAAITVLGKKESKIIAGIRENKVKIRKSLIQTVVRLASPAAAYALGIGDSELKQRLTTTASDLTRMKDEDLSNACMNIIDAINENVDSLAEYNISADKVTALSDLVKKYNDEKPRPRNAVSQRSVHATELKALFRTADDILKNQMDKMIASFKLSDAPFYGPYKKNRTIVDARRTATQIKGTITNSVTGLPIHDAVITVIENGNTVHSGEDGKYSIKPLLPGKYSIVISKTGFGPKTVTDVVAKLGQITTVDLSLVPGA